MGQGESNRLTWQVEAPMELEVFLHDSLNNVLPSKGLASFTKIRRAIVQGRVLVDGRSCRFAKRILQVGMSVELGMAVHQFLAEKSSNDVAFTMDESKLLLKEHGFMVINKPSGIPSEPTIVPGRPNILETIKDYLGRENFVSLAHRLDKETSGALLVVTDQSLMASFHAMFRERRVQKTYRLLCSTSSRFKDLGTTLELRGAIDRVSSRSQQGRWGVVTTGGKEAWTSFTLIQKNQRAMEVLAQPHTGRTHQIRVHAQYLGMPLVGDSLYGSSIEAARIMLHAESLSFPHPSTGKIVQVQVPLPKDFLDTMAGLGLQSPTIQRSRSVEC